MASIFYYYGGSFLVNQYTGANSAFTTQDISEWSKATQFTGTFVNVSNIFATNMTGTNVSATSITGTDCSITYLQSTLFTGTNVSATSITGTDASLTYLSSTTFTGTNISATSITGTNIYVSSQFLGNGSDSVSTPSFAWGGDANCGLYHPTTGAIGFVANATEFMRLNPTGYLGIGTTTPAQKLHVVNGRIRCSHTSSNATLELGTTNQTTYLYTKSTDDSFYISQPNGKPIHAGVNEAGSAITGPLTVHTSVQPQGTGDYWTPLILARDNVYASSTSTSVEYGTYIGMGTNEYNSSSNTYHLIGMGYKNHSDAQYLYYPAYMGYVSSSSDGQTYGDIVMYTRPDGDGKIQPPERMRILSGGKVLIGYTGSQGAYQLQVNGQIAATNGTIAVISDQMYKQNIQPVVNSLQLIIQLEPIIYQFKPHVVHNFATGTQLGFTAQNFEQVFAQTPYLDSFVKTNSCTYTDPTTQQVITEDYKSIGQSNLLPLLVQSIQELTTELTSTKQQLQSIKDAIQTSSSFDEFKQLMMAAFSK